MASREAWGAARGAYEMGASTVSDIARSLGVSHQAVSKRRRDEGWTEPPTPATPAPPAPPREVMDAHTTGEVVAAAANVGAQQATTMPE